MGVRVVPETFNRQDWPRLVAGAFRDVSRDIASLVAGALTDGDKGDITVSGGGAVWTIDNGVVGLNKLANVATATVFYRKTAGAGSPEVQTLATLKTDLGLAGTNSGDQTTIVGITGTLAEFNAALTGADFATGGGTATGANTGDQTITLTGDVTGSGAGSFAATIAADAVTNAKLANMATATFKARTTAGVGDPEDLTGTQATALLDTFTAAAKGLVTSPAGVSNTTDFLRRDGAWAAPGGGGGGTTVTGGITTVNFGAFPGATDCKTTITGQAGIIAGSRLRAWVQASATADHNADEHWVEPPAVQAGSIIPGTGFDIFALSANRRLYGQYTVGWEWI